MIGVYGGRVDVKNLTRRVAAGSIIRARKYEGRTSVSPGLPTRHSSHLPAAVESMVEHYLFIGRDKGNLG